LKKNSKYFLLSLSLLLLTGALSLNKLSNDLSREALTLLSENNNEAILLSRQSVTSDPSNSYAWAVAGKVLLELDRGNEALSYFKKSLSLNPLLKEGLYWGAQADILLADISSAEEKLNILIRSCLSCNESEVLKDSLRSYKKKQLKNNVIKLEKEPNG